MAQRVVVNLYDDIDGSAGEETVVFGLDGQRYEIDLSAANAEQLRSLLAPYVQAGRRRTPQGRHFRRTTVASDPATVRAWARARGIEVPTRGRIPKSVYTAFAESTA
ncbi:histone-like nucleoid-structuring protein Lsr2 [Allostreptomyces psammosilenae]|uniref:Lsr2 protein n=1 Tax=Allostreptomyces psammosilenae TaxID=1892865 RepID=A0A852ZTL6_9ACTN|nr:Lsr2 family protein [Allostreptomyces psammosilenae]NYI05195.1 hypothetical protein [Allostreptomyces psammosilenae]